MDHIEHTHHWPRLRQCAVRVMLLGAGTIAFAFPSNANAQTDYYNTDAGRPIRVEDAYAIERRAVELQVAPFRIQRSLGGTYQWGLEPELAVGLFPRTQVELRVPLGYVDRSAGSPSAGLAGVDLSVLYNLNAETRLPALAVAADVLLPAGPLAPDRAYPSLRGIATRTLSWARFHLNGQYTFGERIASTRDESTPQTTLELSRWMGGLAVDRTFPLRSILLTAEVVAEQPLVLNDPVAWTTGAGTRYQLSPRVTTDAGFGYRLTGNEQGWYVTFGAGVSLGLPWSPRR